MIQGILPAGDLCCRRKVWGSHPEHHSPGLLRENQTKLQWRWGKPPTLMLLKDDVFHSWATRQVCGVAVCFKAPLRDTVSVPRRDERGNPWWPGLCGIGSACPPRLSADIHCSRGTGVISSSWRNWHWASFMLWGRLSSLVLCCGFTDTQVPFPVS